MANVEVTNNGLELLHDQPEIEVASLWNGLSTFADAVSQILTRLPGDSPILITGPWGSGKTTFLKALQSKLESGTRKRRTIWFEAWRCESEGLLLPALIRVVWDAARAGRAPDDALTDAFHLAFFVAVRGMRFAASAFGQKDLAEALGEFKFKELKEDYQSLKELALPPPERDPTAELHNRFADLLCAGWPEAKQPECRPVIFIDDLDRCSPERAVAFIEQIRAIVAQSHALPCTFIVAVDRDVLVRAISAKFASIGAYDGNRYLEKVFPLAFSLPIPEKNAAGELVHKLLKKQRIAIRDNEIPDEEWSRWHEALSTALSDTNFANPRLMKRCINRFAFIKYFERTLPSAAIPLEAEEESDIVLSNWLAATERWPALRRMVYQRRDEWERLDAALKGEQKGPLGPDVELVLHERGASAWLRAQNFAGSNVTVARYQRAELRLRRWGL
jgi:energy-coupling factor transporter ATP-binding protein EcfA2